MESLTREFEQPSEFGERAVGDRKFVGDVRRGRSPSLATADRILAFMEAYDRGRESDGSRIHQSAKEVRGDDKYDGA